MLTLGETPSRHETASVPTDDTTRSFQVSVLRHCLTMTKKECRAVLALLENPTATLDEIADLAGCSRTSLYRMKTFIRLWSELKGEAADRRQGSLRGFKTRDGHTDAWDDGQSRPEDDLDV
jgi:hypothetical protein